MIGISGKKIILTGRDTTPHDNAPKLERLENVYDKLKKTHPGWKDVLNKVNKQPGSNVKPV